jgi:hypothetical protein
MELELEAEHNHYGQMSDRLCRICQVRWAAQVLGPDCWCCGALGRVDYGEPSGYMICFADQVRHALKDGLDPTLLRPPNLYATLEP